MNDTKGMANTYTKVTLQYVIGVKRREALLHKEWREELFRYMGGVINQKGHKTFLVNGVEDHVHLLLGVNKAMCFDDLIRDVKLAANKYINERGLTSKKFYWQEGYGLFSYHKSLVPTLFNYIKNQEEHHKKVTFKEEYIGLLDEFEVDWDERYLFKDLE